MKLSLSSLEAARKNPARFAASIGNPVKIPPSFKTYFVSAVKRFHEGWSQGDVVEFFENSCESRLTAQHYYNVRLTKYKSSLRTYFDTYSKEGLSFVQSTLPVKITLGRHLVSGNVKNLSLRVSPPGYCTILIQLEASDWQNELKWPLVQSAIADQMGCGNGEVEVRSFQMDDGSFDSRSFSQPEIDGAISEATDLLEFLEGL